LRFGGVFLEGGNWFLPPLFFSVCQRTRTAEEWIFAGLRVRLWRRAQFSMLHWWGIFALIMVHVCDGGTGKM